MHADAPTDTTGGGASDGDTDRPVVLLVDDEERITEVFDLWLGDSYAVRTANDGEAALDELDADVDVVLLDRRMPGLSGDEVLERVREEGYDCRVAMVTAADPDFDIVEMPFDDYLCKPVDREELRETVARLADVGGYDAAVRDYFALTRKRAALEAEKSRAELAESEAYDELLAELEERESRASEMLADLDDDGFDELFRDLDDGDD